MSDEIDEEYYEDEVEINLDASHPPPLIDKETSAEEALVNQAVNRSAHPAAPPAVEEDDEEMAELKRRMRELEEEEIKSHPKSDQSNHQSSSHSAHHSSSHSSSYQSSHPPAHQSNFPVVDAEELDSRSVYVGQVDYSATREELEALFSACGPVNRVTILMDKFTGQPKGFAYVEFRDADSVNAATILNDTEFKGRQLKVTPKRTNLPAFQLRGRGRGRGAFRGRGRGAYQAAPYQPPGGGGGYGPQRGRGGGFRGRGGYAPY